MLHLSVSNSHIRAEVRATHKTDFRPVRKPSSQRSNMAILQWKICCPSPYRLCMLSLLGILKDF